MEQLVFFEEAAAAHAPDDLDIIGKYLAGPAIMAHGTADQKERHLPRILSAKEIWCEGFSEPGAGSDLAAVSTRATHDSDGYSITGRKIWTTNGSLADFCYLLAATSDGPRHHNLTVFLFDMRQPGVTVTPLRDMSNDAHLSEVFLDGARATTADVLGKEGAGWQLSSLLGFRSERQAWDGLRRYVQMREWFDQLQECTGHAPIAAASVQHLEVRLELLKWHVRRTVSLMDAGGAWFPTAAVIKLYWSELIQDIATAGLQGNCRIHRDYWRQRFLESRSATIAGGTAQLQRNVIADVALALPR
jgi:alkylation response protein AidB-like acyl-CoA dehydrogenase